MGNAALMAKQQTARCGLGAHYTRNAMRSQSVSHYHTASRRHMAHTVTLESAGKDLRVGADTEVAVTRRAPRGG